ncbi:MAG: FecR domain-containing protein [Pseudomonadota bacterium]
MRFTAKIAVVSALSVLLSGASVQAQTTIGTAVSVDDTVVGNNARRISTSSPVFANERIRANATGLGHFEFTDGTKMVVGPGTNLVLDELVYNPGGSTFNKFVLRTTSGAARFISGSSNSSAYEIQTPVGTLGIRGTAFDLNHFRGRTYIMLVSGRLEFCSNSGQCQEIRRKCDFVVINANGQISSPSQPRNGIFGGGDMGQFFPFINNQSRIEQGFRLRTNTCKGGARAGGGGGGDDGNQDRDLDGGGRGNTT